MWNWVKHHKQIVWPVVCIFVGFIPPWFQAVWGLWQSEPFFQWLASKQISCLWVWTPWGIIFAVTLVFAYRAVKTTNQNVAINQRPLPLRMQFKHLYEVAPIPTIVFPIAIILIVLLLLVTKDSEIRQLKLHSISPGESTNESMIFI